MADETVRKLLIKLGISTADWRTAVNDIKNQLNAVNERAKSDAAQMKQTQKEQLDLTKQQIVEQQRLTAEARTLSAVDQAKATWQKKQQEAIKTATAQRVLETTEVKKQALLQANAVKMAQEQVRLEQQRLRLSEQQRASMERQQKAQTKSEGGRGGGIFGTVASAVVGGGTVGMLTGAVAGGEVIAKGFEVATEKLKELVGEMINATGSDG